MIKTVEMAVRGLLCPRQGLALVSRATSGCTFMKQQSISMTPTVLYRQLQKQSRQCQWGACSITLPVVNHKTALHTGSSIDAKQVIFRLDKKTCGLYFVV